MTLFLLVTVQIWWSILGYRLKLVLITRISFFHLLFSIIRVTSGLNLYYPKKSIKRNKLTKYSKQFKKHDKF